MSRHHRHPRCMSSLKPGELRHFDDRLVTSTERAIGIVRAQRLVTMRVAQWAEVVPQENVSAAQRALAAQHLERCLRQSPINEVRQTHLIFAHWRADRLERRLTQS